MRLHILGICGTFMGSLALLARQLGHTVSGSDENVYPPMSTQLEQQGIALHSGYDADFLNHKPDLVAIGNALSRGNAAVEAVLNQGVPYCSGPDWLSRHVLQGRWVLAVAGTHGKTTATSMLAWILDQAGLHPGFLVGGIAKDFGISARLGDGQHFVIEADEYDSAFFDKRSKFVHYRSRTAILNNLEFDHADIFADLAAIQTQFHHFVRTIPGDGMIVLPEGVAALDSVLAQGCWTPVEYTACDAQSTDARWQALPLQADCSEFMVQECVFANGEKTLQQHGTVSWAHTGAHNMQNAIAAIAAADHAGVAAETSIAALSAFSGVKRRMEKLAELRGVTLYDDFAHHPTAIASTLQGLRKQQTDSRIIAVIEPRSNTMRMGVHKQELLHSVTAADHVVWFQGEGVQWLTQEFLGAGTALDSVDAIVEHLVELVQAGDHIVIMSNGGFGGIQQKIIAALQVKQ
ncbi:MAG: UDP-N-acetylmuramate:L-alanyl-gamma-D-glutamyl-meso-diaminopimelate ligase [Pseudomonadales bacterium]